MAMPYLDRIPSGKPKDRLLRFISPRHADRHRFHLLSEVERTVLPHVVLTQDGVYAFMKNPKAGCTSVTNLLWLRDHGHMFDGNIHEAPFGPGSRRQDLLKIHDSLPHAFRFSVVRDPVRRAVSGFFNFFVERKNRQAHLHWEALAGFGFLRKDDLPYRFDVFLDYIEASMSICPVRTDRHFRAQHINIAHDFFDLHHVARLESLQEDLDRIGEMTGAPLPSLASLPKTRRNPSGSSSFMPSVRQVVRLESLYARDLDLYGY